MSVTMVIIAQSVKDDLPLEFLVRFAAQVNLKEFATFCRPSEILCSARLLKWHDSGSKGQTQQINVNMTQRITFSGLHNANGGNFTAKGEEEADVTL